MLIRVNMKKIDAPLVQTQFIRKKIFDPAIRINGTGPSGISHADYRDAVLNRAQDLTLGVQDQWGLSLKPRVIEHDDDKAAAFSNKIAEKIRIGSLRTQTYPEFLFDIIFI